MPENNNKTYEVSRYVAAIRINVSKPIIFSSNQIFGNSKETIEEAKKTFKQRKICTPDKTRQEVYRKIGELLEYASQFGAEYEGGKNSEKGGVEVYLAFETIPKLEEFIKKLKEFS